MLLILIQNIFHGCQKFNFYVQCNNVVMITKANIILTHDITEYEKVCEHGIVVRVYNVQCKIPVYPFS